jgi:DnaJ-class molecular chaperone
VSVTYDYYKILAVPGDALPAKIKAAFRKKAMRYHPDHNPGREAWANKKLQSIIEAYEVLSNPTRRRLYDRQLARVVAIPVTMKTRQQPKSTKQVMVDIMRHRSTPAWARTVAFAYVFFDYLSKEAGRAD